MNEYVIAVRSPSVAEFVELRRATGLTPKTPEAAEAALGRSLYAVCVEAAASPGRALGMGRVIGDAGCWFVIVDVAVHPDHQKRGLGRRIVGELVGFIERTAPPSAQAMLLADVPADRLYEAFGFRRSAPGCVGMIRLLG